MILTKNVWIGKIWQYDGRRSSELENKYRVFVKEKDKETGMFVLRCLATDEVLMCYPETLTDVYEKPLFVNAYETFDLRYCFPQAEIPDQLTKEELLRYEQIYNDRNTAKQNSLRRKL